MYSTIDNSQGFFELKRFRSVEQSKYFLQSKLISVEKTLRQTHRNVFFFGRKHFSVKLGRNIFLGLSSSRSKLFPVKKLLCRTQSRRFSSVKSSRTVFSRSKLFSVEIFLGGKNSSGELVRKIFPRSNLVEMMWFLG